MLQKKSRTLGRAKRKLRIRSRIIGRPECPRLVVFKSNQHIYAQVIDDTKGETLVSASSVDKELKLKKRATVKSAKEVGDLLAKRALQKGLQQMVFDRGGFRYHGKLKVLADAVREKGLKF